MTRNKMLSLIAGLFGLFIASEAMAECVVYSSPPSSNPGDRQALACNTDGKLMVDGAGGGGGGGGDVNITEIGGNAVTSTLPVSGTVNVGNFPATQPVSGTVTVNAINSAGSANTGTVTAAPYTDPTGAASGTIISIMKGMYIQGDQLRQAQPTTCNLSAPINVSASGNTQLVALTAAQRVYVCGYNFIAAGDVNVKLVSGAGTACATSPTDLTGPYPLAANGGISYGQGTWNGIGSVAGQALCINLSASVQVSGVVSYAKF